MGQIYKNKLNLLGYTQLVCDIFPKWEDVKDEILIPERKSGTGNGTIHVFLGAADNDLQKEFSTYYRAVNNGEDPSVGAIKIKHFFLASNVLSMLGYVCQYYYSKGVDPNDQVKAILSLLSSYPSENGLLQTSSLFKLSVGSSRLRPYFKQFDGNGVFTKLIRQLLLPNSGYKISLYKNGNGEYAAFWLIGFDWQTDFEANSNKDLLSKKNTRENDKSSLQQIFYGAPGTGKSYKVKELTGEDNVVRTTFHPDSDYSTFVGCYKPTSIEVPMRDVTGKVIVENGQKVTENRIVYEFVEQAFLKAYIKAWKMYAEDENNPKKQYLVIEEINRGNCAQIFGDLFQLLDRGANGFSEYPIDADKDMQKHLAKAFKDMAYLEAPAIGEMSAEETARTIRNGEKLILPSNLYIWATMNTSDQSLFPIDSAFKRRWDWQYVPIHNCDKGWRIAANGKQYDWWDFIEKINNVISKLTSSEDKKLGYFFCKADNDGTVSADKLVAKVLFYLWNDVFKDYEVDSNILRDGESSLNFNSFYGVNGNETFIRQDKVDLFLSNLGVNLIRNNSVDDEPEEDEDGNEFSSSSKNYDKFSVNGIGRYGKNRLAFECLKKYVELNSNMSADEVLRIWKNLEMNVPHFVESKDEYESRTDNSKRSYAVSCGGTIIYVAHNGYGSNGKVDELISIVNRQGWGINLARVL